MTAVQREFRGLRYRFEVSQCERGSLIVGTNLDAGGETEYRGGDGRWQRTVRNRRKGTTTTDFVGDRQLIALLDEISADAVARSA
jgi:hypothetical protein